MWTFPQSGIVISKQKVGRFKFFEPPLSSLVIALHGFPLFFIRSLFAKWPEIPYITARDSDLRLPLFDEVEKDAVGFVALLVAVRVESNYELLEAHCFMGLNRVVRLDINGLSTTGITITKF